MNQATIVVGLTGQTGAGKSTVCGILRDRGLTIIDADLVSREVVSEGKQCLADLALEFSVMILNANGTLNRRKLGSMVFSDRKKLKRMNEIIFPYIIEEIENRIKAARNAGIPMVILDAPTLFESGADRFCDVVISVLSPEEERLNRIVERDRISYEEAQNRINSQHKDQYYIRRSGYLIRNTGDLEDLRVKTIEVLDQINASRSGE